MTEEKSSVLPTAEGRVGTGTVAWGSVGSFGPPPPVASREALDHTLAAPLSSGDPASFAETLAQPLVATGLLAETLAAPLGGSLSPSSDSLVRTLVRSTVLPHVEIAGTTARLVQRDRTRYEHEHLLGQGGVGEVVRVKDHDIDRTVAVKRLREGVRDAGSVARFVDEIRTIGQLEHPNIVPIHDVGVDEEGQLFFVMKYVEGETLESIIEKLQAGDPVAHRRYTHERRVEIFLGSLEAVHYAHARGIIHRDLKPANVMVGPFGEVMVMDWGLAKRIRGNDELALLPADESSPAGDTGRDLFKTRAGTLLGTPAYMSPEQARAQKDLDERSDIYSLCVMFHELLGLDHYLADQTTLASMLVAVQERPAKNVAFVASPHQHSPAADLGHFVAKGLHKNPGDRYRSVEQMIDRLRDRAAGDIPIECPVTGLMSVGHRAIRFIERHPYITMTLVSLVILGSLAASAYIGARIFAALAQQLHRRFSRRRLAPKGSPMDLWHTPSFAMYAMFAVGLSGLLLGIDGFSGGKRVATKTVVNGEDASSVNKDAELVQSDPEGVARVMRAHRNALANIVPFLFVMFLYVALGATTTWVLALCGIFAVARLAHAAAYIGAKQPFRTASFVIGQGCTVVAMVQVIRAAFPLLA